MVKSSYTDSKFKELVSHVISNRPYSLHRTFIPADCDLVLYQHLHDEIELFYLESGEVEFIIEDRCIPLKEGEAILIPPGLLHMALNPHNRNCCFYAFLFSTVLFSEAYSPSSYTRFIQPLKHNGALYVLSVSPVAGWQKRFLKLLLQILGFYNRQDIENWELELHGLLFQLWNLYYTNHMLSVDLSGTYQKLYDKLKNSLLYIQEKYSEDLTLEQLAGCSGLSKGAFCRYFKELTGTSPITYLVRLRIRKSCELLINSDLKITQVANQCGFYNISHYNRAFLQYMKCTPTEYRRQYPEISNY
jgi:AraC-like DNA-binding protein/mannose-6-phosphate isomerase-like protein (cupin superfamily)